MAPKKNMENVKPPRKRVVKPKPQNPPLKSPTIIRVKIPIVDSSASNGIIPKLTKKELTIQKKVELANEVAFAQLCKKETICQDIPTPPQIAEIQIQSHTGKGKRKSSTPMKFSPKKPRNKAPDNISLLISNSEVSETNIKEENGVSEPSTETKNKDKAKKIPTPDKAGPNLNKSDGSNNLSSEENPASPVPKKIRKCGKPKIVTDSPKTDDIDHTVNVNEVKIVKKPGRKPAKEKKVIQTPKPKIVKKVSSPSTTLVQTRKSTRIANNVIRISTSENNNSILQDTGKESQSPSILKQVIKLDESVKPAGVESRKPSVSSTNSRLSWTQDISTSSTTTCVTVTSKDFVRFDKKLPLVSVDDISQVDPPKTVENDMESSSDSSDSDSDSSSSSSSSEDIPIPTPRLSTTSSTTSRDYAVDVQSDTEKITAALERLTVKIKETEANVVQLINSQTYDNRYTEFDTVFETESEREVMKLFRSIDDILDPKPTLNNSFDSDSFTTDRVPYRSFEYDDDALSIFAESITGMETSQISSTPVREYVPTPIYNYRPKDAVGKPSVTTSRPFSVPTVPETVLFRTTCFHNLVSRCPFVKCLYTHTIPTVKEISRAVMSLDAEKFEHERALVARYPALKRYEPAFEAEAHRRSAPETSLETALQCLNGAMQYASVLQRPFGARCLADLMLEALADTQNFSRFKRAFVKLARFVADRRRPVDIDVATKILERVCILPAEADVSRAMIDIAKTTDPEIYRTDKMTDFEVKLAEYDKTLYDELLATKPRLTRPQEREKRYASPDTTHLDTLNNQPEVLTRTVDFKRTLSSKAITFDQTVPSPVQGFREPYAWRKPMYTRTIRRPMRRPMMHGHNMGTTRPFMQRVPNNLNRQVSYGYHNMTPNRYMRRPRNGI